MNNEFLVNCLQAIIANINNIQMALVAYMGYLQGSNDANQMGNPLNATSLQLEETNGLKAEITANNDNETENENIPIIFTNKELSIMPLQFRKEYRIDGSVVRCRKRPTGQNKYTYEMRYRRDGYNVTATAKNLEECKAKFLQKLKEADKQQKTQEKTTNFKIFALYYYENFKKRQVKENTYKVDFLRLNNYLLPAFGKFDLKEIKPDFCQNFIDGLVQEGKSKTAEALHSLLNQLFKGAIKHGYITHNPLDLVVRHKHEREHGKAFTLQQEKEFLTACNGSKYRALFITALYTGMRPNEYEHAEFKGDFVVTINSKRKNGKIEYKKIPISPMFAPYVTENFKKSFTMQKNTPLNTVRKHFLNAMPEFKLYDLRTTFYTRCEMCNVNEKAKNHFVGHSNGVLGDTYTDLPDDFLYSEAQKIRYNL